MHDSTTVSRLREVLAAVARLDQLLRRSAATARWRPVVNAMSAFDTRYDSRGAVATVAGPITASTFVTHGLCGS